MDDKPSDGALDAADSQLATTPAPISFQEFLESVPPTQWRSITDVWFEIQGRTQLSYPELKLHCATQDLCNRLSVFRMVGDGIPFYNKPVLNTYLTYRCSNCRKMEKSFSLQVVKEDGNQGRCYKYGESPAFGPQTPPRLQRLLQADRALFMKGRRCESQGLGIGAFVYYRRVVENQKNQILDEIIKVSKKVGASAEILTSLERAKAEIQFSRAMETVKDAIPQALLINGANPLTLLHSALSVGVHAQSDEQCLVLAHDVRVVLVELAERLGQALKDEAELNTAVTRLMNVRQVK
jgi:hypothetical protein